MNYRFHGQTIKLDPVVYDLWKMRFHAIPDFESELWSLDTFYTAQNVDKWFIRAERALNNKHQEWTLKRGNEVRLDHSLTRPVKSEQEARIYMLEHPWLFHYNPEDEPPVKRVPADWVPKLRAVK